MKKVILMPCSAIIITMAVPAVSLAAEKLPIGDAFKQGIISIKITGIDNGERVELKAKRQSEKPIIISIGKGKTDIAGKVTIYTDKELSIDLSIKDEGSIILPQTGNQRIKSGSMTVSMSPKK